MSEGSVDAFDLSDPPMRDRYDTFFESCEYAFIQQSTYWADVVKELGPRPDKPIFLLYSEHGETIAGLPLYYYDHPLGSSLSSVPHPGPMGGVFVKAALTESQREKAYAALINSAVELAIKHECLSLTILSNPFEPDAALYEKYLLPTYVFENFTQCIDVREVFDYETKRLTMPSLLKRSNLSRNVNKAVNAGFAISDCSSMEDLMKLYDVQVKRHNELGAEPLSPKLFENIFKILVPRGKAKILLLKRGDQIASGCLYLLHRGVLDVLRLCMDSAFADDSPNFLNTHHSLQWAAQNGVRYYNWQSSPSREDGVYRYKKTWGSREASYSFFTRLFCKPERIAAIGLPALKTEYPWHFVVPYAVFNEGFEKREFKK